MGRPLKYKTVEDLQDAIDKYFERCDSNTKTVLHQKTGELITIPYPIPYTVEGLAATLEVDRRTITNYEERSEFFPTIKKAKNKILQNLKERALLGDNVASITIFNLKNNYGYTDKQEIEHSGGQKTEHSIDFKKLTDEQLDEYLRLTKSILDRAEGESEEEL